MVNKRGNKEWDALAALGVVLGLIAWSIAYIANAGLISLAGVPGLTVGYLAVLGVVGVFGGGGLYLWEHK